MSTRSNGSQSSPFLRDNASQSGSGSSSGRNRAVESAVTRLLMKIDENQVSDVYVRLGNDFNAAVAAFAASNIQMTELLSVPDDLRNVLEQCLAEDATPENLEIYLPTVRQIITNLLQGLRGKQALYARIARPRSEQSGHDRVDSRSSRGERSSRREGSHRSTGSRSIVDGGERLERDSTSSSRRSGYSSSMRGREETPPVTEEEERLVGGFTASMPQPSPGQTHEDENTIHGSNSVRNQRHRYASSESHNPPPSHSAQSLPLDCQSQDVTARAPVVPANVKRYSLVDPPVPPPTVVIEPSSPGAYPPNPSSPSTSETPPPPQEVPAAVATSLAALKKNDVLERRASKRFSTFNISKMTGSSASSRDRSLRANANRRSLAVGSALTPGELAVLTEVDDDDLNVSPSLRRDGSIKRSRSISRDPTPEQGTPPVPPLPPLVKPPEPPIIVAPKEDETIPSQIAYASGERITVFLQVGREVKKAVIEPNISFSSLRVLFVDKFSYNPGQDNFPAIYIRDPSSGVQYELEDMDEVKEKCLLSLNIEPLDQIKQHIDSQISSLSNDIKELKSVIAVSNRPPMVPNIVAESLAESTPFVRPSDRQFQNVASRISRFISPGSSSSAHFITSIGMAVMQPQMTGQSIQTQPTGSSVLSEYSSRIMTDLKTQFDEVQHLRRDLGIMRQLYTEFMKQTKESLGALRTQTQSVKQLASSNVGGARAFIDSGKKKLDSRSQNLLTDVEKLLDMVENMKDDVTKRQITPKEQVVKGLKKDLDSAAAELENLREHIKTIKPMWKKTWEEELQNIVEEQQFLTHQEEFLTDLLEDHKAAVEVYGHIEKVISLRGYGANGKGKGIPRNRNFKPAAEDGSGRISNVMLEIRGVSVDPEKRMEAIKANEKLREKEKAGQSDELQAELTDFVGNKKLRMTGGAEEADRVRQKRSEATLKAMFNQNPSLSPPLLLS